MKHILLLFCLIFSLSCFPQAKKIKVKKEEEKKEKPKITRNLYHGSWDLYYGNRIFKSDYYNQLNTVNQIDLGKPQAIAGFGISGYPFNFGAGKRVFRTQVNYYKIIPATIFIEDTLQTKVSGFVGGFGIGKGFFTKKQTIGIIAYLGFNAGRTTLSKNEYITMKNPFFSPKITLQPKVVIQRFVISLIAEAEYDLSNPAWKQTIFEKKALYPLQPFSQTCFTGIVSIGLAF